MPAAAAVEEPNGEKRKLPQDPNNSYSSRFCCLSCKLDNHWISQESLGDWVPVHLKRCPEATYDALRVDVKTITAADDSLSIYCVAEHRPKEGVRLML